MIQKNLNLTAEQRLNGILEKITSNKKITKKEKMFLDAWQTENEEEINYQMNQESGKEFMSDDGYFKFILNEYEVIEDCTIITGTIVMPDPVVNDFIMRLSGNILIFKENHVALDFRVNELEIFEFIEGKEEQLDDFISEIIEIYSN